MKNPWPDRQTTKSIKEYRETQIDYNLYFEL